METRQLLIEVETEEQFKVMILLIIVTYFIHNSYYTDIIDTEKLAVETGNKGQGSGKTTPYLVCSLSFGLSALIPAWTVKIFTSAICVLLIPPWMGYC